MDSLQYQMIMALNAADSGTPIRERAAAICAEMADQHCAELHLSVSAPLLRRESSIVSKSHTPWAP